MRSALLLLITDGKAFAGVQPPAWCAHHENDLLMYVMAAPHAYSSQTACHTVLQGPPHRVLCSGCHTLDGTCF